MKSSSGTLQEREANSRGKRSSLEFEKWSAERERERQRERERRERERE